jgi:hypothetical protein
MGSQGLQGQQNFLQGQQNQLSGIGVQGNLAGQAGMNDWQRLMGGFGAGTTMAQQGDVETQRRLNLIQSLMGGAMGASINVPGQTTPSGAQQGANFGGGLAQLLMQSGMFGGQGGGGQGGWSEVPGQAQGGGDPFAQWLNQMGNARG